MNTWIFVLIVIGIIFFAGKFVYDQFGQQILDKFNLPSMINKNGLQAGSVNRTSGTQ